MAFQGFKSEFKSIQTVWVLNALPPGLGFGTIYACGPLATLFVLPGLAYMIQHHLSIESILTSYVLVSVLGTLGAFYHNVKLTNDLYGDTINGAEAEDKLTEESFALDSFERKLMVAERMLKSERKDVLEIKVEKPDLESGIIVRDEPVAVSNPVEQEVLAKLFSDETSESTTDQVELEPVSVSISEPEERFESPAMVESVVDLQPTFPQLEVEPAVDSTDAPVSEAVLALSEEKRIEVDTVLKKLGDATGEFQPEVSADMADAFNVSPFENYQFSSGYEQFNFELPTAFESAYQSSVDTESKNLNVACADCGAELNPSFSFCLACGKVL